MPETTKKAAAKKTAAKKTAAKKATASANANAKASASTSAIDDIVDDYLALTSDAVKSYADLARSAGKRLAGEESSKAGSWAEDATKFWGLVARDQVRAMKLFNDVMEQATKPAGKG